MPKATGRKAKAAKTKPEDMQGMRQERGRTTRASVLLAARKLFAQNGFRGTSLAAIALEVGITDAGLLYHFPTKKDLLLAVIIETDQEQDEHLLDRRAQTTGLEYLRTWSEFGRILEEDPVLVALDIQMSSEHLQTDSAFNQYYKRRYARFRSQLIAAFKEGRAEGLLRDDFDPETEAVLMLATLDGLRLQWLLSQGKISMATSMQYFIRHMIERIVR